MSSASKFFPVSPREAAIQAAEAVWEAAKVASNQAAAEERRLHERAAAARRKRLARDAEETAAFEAMMELLTPGWLAEQQRLRTQLKEIA